MFLSCPRSQTPLTVCLESTYPSALLCLVLNATLVELWAHSSGGSLGRESECGVVPSWLAAASTLTCPLQPIPHAASVLSSQYRELSGDTTCLLGLWVAVTMCCFARWFLPTSVFLGRGFQEGGSYMVVTSEPSTGLGAP